MGTTPQKPSKRVRIVLCAAVVAAFAAVAPAAGVAADWTSKVAAPTADWTSADWTSADWTSADWTSADWTSADWTSRLTRNADWTSADWTSATWTSKHARSAVSASKARSRGAL